MTDLEKKEIREIFTPKAFETQTQFEDYMIALNEKQNQMIRPYQDRMHQIQMQIDMLEAQRLQIAAQKNAAGQEMHLLGHSRHDINQFFHELKHETIALNPRDKFVKPKDDKETQD